MQHLSGKTLAVLVCSICVFAFFVFPGASQTDEDELTQQDIDSPPIVNEEERLESHIPTGMKCDACLAVAYQLSLGFNQTQTRQPSKYLKESDIIDLTEYVCALDEFEEYGVKYVQGRNSLSGPGLGADEEPEMVQEEGNWQYRLQDLCADMVETFGEKEMYDAYRKDKLLVKTLCHGKGTFGTCNQNNQKDEF